MSLIKVFYTTVFFCILYYLAGNLTAFFSFICFFLFILTPLSILAISFFSKLEIPESLCDSLGIIGSFFLLIPIYFVRKFFSNSIILFDLALCVSCVLAAYRIFQKDSLLKYVNNFSKDFWGIILIIIPALIALSWAGFEAKSNGSVAYYGLHLIDTGTLSGVISSIHTADFQPLSVIDGLGELNYHWFYFAIPAYLSDFFGISLRHANSMILINLLMAQLLFLTIYKVSGVFLQKNENTERIQILSTLLMFTSSESVYFYVPLVINDPIKNNNVFLTLYKSMNFFGNNTLALICIMHAIMMIPFWNRLSKPVYIFLIMALFSSTIGLSITLSFCVYIGIVLYFFSGNLREPKKVLLIGAFTTLAFLFLFKLSGVFGGGHSSQLAIQFDYGLYLKNFVLWFLPVVFISTYGYIKLKGDSLFSANIIACLIVPSFFMIADIKIGRIDFCAKTATLLLCFITPFFSKAIEIIDRSRKSVFAIASVVLLFIGTADFGMEISYIVVQRVFPSIVCYRSISEDYFAALEYIRENSNKKAIVVDPYWEELVDIHLSTVISQRRLFLPVQKDYDYKCFKKLPEEVHNRRKIWNDWKNAGFNNTEYSKYFASNADYIVVDSEKIDINWKKVFDKGKYKVYESLLRNK
ncbi:MAG: hypothetical protein HQM10_02560 [Candidatus Riflebacteria bacterium]|nr:hypothetical protein [Candidatus Riflebacteria bacterium]